VIPTGFLLLLPSLITDFYAATFRPDFDRPPQIERTVRQNMKREGLKDLPILPECRPSKHPSAGQILETFAHRSEHQLYEGSTLIKTFIDPLLEIETMVLRLLDLPQEVYLQTPPPSPQRPE